MADAIDQLNFEVILDDKKFVSRVSTDLELARDLNTSLSNLLNLKKRLNGETTKEISNAEKVKREVEKTNQEKAKTALAEQKVRTEIERTKALQNAHTDAVRSTNNALLNTSSIMRTLSQLTGITFSVATIRRFVSSMIEITGQFELQKVALKTILQDAEGAERIFEQLYQFSSDSMYRFSELAKHAKQLAAFGIEQDKLLDTTKMLGDVASGLGVSMDRIILAYGHVKSSGFLRGIQLRSFSQNGVPILQELAKMFEEVEGRAVSLGEVFDRMTKRQIDFAMVEEAFRRMTAEGGQFHNIQEQMARTLAGEINVLKGRWENLMYAMGEQTEGFVLTIVRAISESISSLDKFKKTLSDLWEAGSPVWALYGAMRDWIGEARQNKGKGGKTSIEGGGFGPDQGGGSRGALNGGGGSRGDDLEKEEAVLVKISNIEAQILAEEKEINRLRKKAKDEGLDTGLGGGTNEVQLLQNAVDARDEALKEYKNITGEDYYKQRKSGAKSSEQQQREQIQLLRSDATFLRKLADAYKSLEPYLGKDTNAKMVEIFGKGDYSKEGIEQKLLRITEALRGMGKEGKEAADSIEESWGLDKVSQAKNQLEKDKKAADDAQKSLKKYLDTMQDWADKNDVGAFGGAIKKYYKALSDSDKTAKNAMSSLLLGTTDEGERLLGYANINAEWARSRANSLNTLKQDIDKYAETYLKEELERKGFDLTDWADKNIEQINAIRDAIQEIQVSDTLKETILGQEGGENLLAMLNEALEKIKQAKIDKTVDPERWKKIAKQAKYIAERFLSVSKSLKEFADASGNTALSDAASRIGALAQNIKAAEEGYKTFGGWWGAVIGGGADLIEQVLEGLTATEIEAKELRDAVRDIRQETEKQSFKDALLDGTDGVFGENFVRRLKNAVVLLDQIRGRVNALEYTKPERNWLGAYNDEDMMDWERWNALRNGNPGSMPFVTSHSWLTGDTTRTLDALAKEFNLELTDKNGFLNPTLLQAIIDKYGELNEGAIDWLTDSIRYAEQYEEAMQQIEDATKDTFSGLASSMADEFIDNFMRMGNAVDDLSDTFANLGDAILRSFLQSYILDEILGKYEEQAKNALTKYSKGEMTPDEYASWLSGFAENVQKDSETLAPAINSMIEAFKDRGLMNIDEDTASSLGSGIKSITEDTANLLASYINAIRADVSYIRGMQEKGWGAITTLGASIPTLNDHIAQIAATNFDIAQTNQSILAELRSVIGPVGTSGMVVRVEYA